MIAYSIALIVEAWHMAWFQMLCGFIWVSIEKFDVPQRIGGPGCMVNGHWQKHNILLTHIASRPKIAEDICWCWIFPPAVSLAFKMSPSMITQNLKKHQHLVLQKGKLCSTSIKIEPDVIAEIARTYTWGSAHAFPETATLCIHNDIWPLPDIDGGQTPLWKLEWQKSYSLRRYWALRLVYLFLHTDTENCLKHGCPCALELCMDLVFIHIRA